MSYLRNRILNRKGLKLAVKQIYKKNPTESELKTVCWLMDVALYMKCQQILIGEEAEHVQEKIFFHHSQIRLLYIKWNYGLGIMEIKSTMKEYFENNPTMVFGSTQLGFYCEVG